VGWRSWRDIAAAWESAVNKESGSAAAIKTFKNTELGETWVEEGEAPDWQRLIERREDYRVGTLPGWLAVGGAADVQKDRIEASIWAFGRGKESWLVEHRVLMGDTARDAVWKRFAELIWPRPGRTPRARAMPLARLALDTGFATQEAYAFVRQLP
jgi:phage terminase large subunit GpA-like protein